MDRDGSSGDTPLDKAEVGFAFLVCAGNHPRRVSERLGRRHKTVGMWAQQMVSLVRRWLPDRSIKLMGDTAYSVLELGLHANAKPGDSDHDWSTRCRATFVPSRT